MKVLLIKNNHLYSYNLPYQVKDNFWITDIDSFNNVRNLINIVAEDNKWYLKSNYDTQIISTAKSYDEVVLLPYNFYTIKNDNEKDFYYIYVLPSVEMDYISYRIMGNGILSIGSNASNDIAYNYALVDDVHAKIEHTDDNWQLIDNNSKFGVYVNDEKIPSMTNYLLKYGDIVFIGGLKIIIMRDFILVNNIENKVKVSNQILSIKEEEVETFEKEQLKDEALSRSLYAKEDYFYRSPRFIEEIVRTEIVIDDPPAKIQGDETSLIMVIGPMFTMALTSLTTAFTTINSIVNGDTTWKKATPSLVIAGAMFASMLIWPLITRILDKKKKKKREKERVEKYTAYLESKEKEIESIIAKQTQTLKDKYISLAECQSIILRKKINLWERSINQKDFLSLRLGIGNIPLLADIKYSKEKFSLEEDKLKSKIGEIVNTNNTLNGVPITVSLVEKYVTSIIGSDDVTYEFFKGLLLQMITFHSYEFLKIIVLTNDENVEKWNYLRNLPYLFDDLKQIRFFATNIDDTREVSMYLEKIYQERKISQLKDFNDISQYYLIITDNYHMYRDVEIVKDVLNQQQNVGFSLVIFSEKIQNLPSECKSFINVNREKSGIFESEVMAGNQKEFVTEFCNEIDLNQCINRISNIPIEFDDEEKKLPNVLSFLEMYNVGKVEQLNISNRWKTNNSQKTLAVPIGMEKAGTTLKIDLHEKYHGPHGLIAGMTGSGKSELIITYILSMAVNFSPLDVAFILIDYKGGGLAGAFENRETGVRLPHLVGTITNLDINEMNRSLSSIQSELRRRQQIFSVARDKLGESTVDIYKYQKFFKAGLVDEPIPHLFIICDEFAELKSQQPDFMDQLISVARIGRSLGIHLILATQKPSGVVNDQIWSNSRFRICLKVQEKSDSNEMIKMPDAAYIKQVGRFYLQVGYNELFVLGQSAWCGSQYYPAEKLKKRIDQSVVVIDNIGNVVISNDDEEENSAVSLGEELGNILKNIIDVSNEYNYKAKQLWLEKIPEKIFVDNLAHKYNYQAQPFVLNPIIGEYDDPGNQFQNLATINLTKDGNVSIYGSSGSGKELLLTTMIYSLIINHSLKEINIYALDFGAGTLTMFKNAPQVGDVALPSEEEKIDNLFKSIQKEIEERKKIFINYNGDYEVYCQRSENKLPYILVFINNYDVFQDMFDAYENTINGITRECSKYGIIFITTLNSVSGMRYRLRQNFKSDITLQLNDQDDYSVIIGNTHRLYPLNLYGRGLIKLDKIYEFQTAYPTELENINEFINTKVADLQKNEVNKAPIIPVVPEEIYVDDLVPSLINNKNVPLGINKELIKPEVFNFNDNYVTLVTGKDLADIKPFSKALIDMFSNLKNDSTIVIDVGKMATDEFASNVIYVDSDIDANIKKIINNVNFVYDEYVKNKYKVNYLQKYRQTNIIILNFDKFMLQLSNDDKKDFEQMFINGKDLKIFNFVLIDYVDKFKSIEYNNWCKVVVNYDYGIWIGNGITDQACIKTNLGFRNNLNDISNDFGVVVRNGKVQLIKLMKRREDII